MSHPVIATNLSVEEFAVYDVPDWLRGELVRGELQVTPGPGAAHGAVTTILGTRLHIYVEARKLGRVLINCSFELVQLPRTVRVPDVAFVRMDRLPADGIEPGFMRVPPDLAVEIISPSETRARLGEKLDDYRAVAIPLVWLIDPRKRTVTVIEGDLPAQQLGEGDALAGGTVIPGFRCEIRDLFEGLART